MLDAEAASRLCTACGMCCSGVLFEIVKLQPEDSIRDLEKLGMQINRKKTEPYFKQPCRFLDDCTCKIYEQRPTRCRRFSCFQLELLAAGEIDEAAALAKIQEARSKVASLKSELEKAGDFNTDTALTERVEQVLISQPNEGMMEQMRELKIFLGRHFRTLT
ncbi:MAG: YkgJ family cysteine cluster protein [Verrucomicrobia bacterium]|nr:YkgJ family cysteine cluster protein [Verrucomicrobiota bacterium]